MIEEIFYFFQFFIKLTKRRKLMKKFLLSAIVFCCLGTTSCFSVNLSADELGAVLQSIDHNNPRITDDAGKVWKIHSVDEKMGIPIPLMSDIRTIDGRDPSSVDVGGSITFMLTIPQTRYLTFDRER